MFHARVGETFRLRCFYIESSVGKAGLTVTNSYLDESGNAVTGQSATAESIDGYYYYNITPDAPGSWSGKFSTATTTVDQMDLPWTMTVESALTTGRCDNLDNLDAAVSSLPTTGSIADGVWDELLNGHVTAGSAGAKLNLVSAGKVTVVSAVSASGDKLTLTRSNDYLASEVTFSSTGWWDITGATSVTLTVRRKPGSGTDTVIFASTDASSARVAGDGVEQTLGFVVSSTQTASIEIGTNVMQYDIELISSGKYKTLITGLADGVADITRA